jgi:hypothetical protein
MSFFSWLRKRTSIGSPRGRARHRFTPSRFRPQLEILEGRDVPSTLTVTNNLDNGSVGSLRYEIGQAHKGDTIVFAPSLDGQTIVLGGSELDIAKNLTIQGPGAGLLTINGGRQIINATGSRVFAVEKHTNVTLSGLTITGGGGTASAIPYYFPSPFDNDGGGILNLGTLTVSACTVSGNYASPNSASSYGGGIYNAGALTVSASTISGNYAEAIIDVGLSPGPTNNGGGIYNAGSMTVTGSTISGNFAATDGGGIYNAGTATISNCTLSGNTTFSFGGAIYNAGTMTVSGCTVSNNIADIGAGSGIYNAGTLTVSSSTFSGNFGVVGPSDPNGNNIFGPYTDGGGNTFG